MRNAPACTIVILSLAFGGAFGTVAHASTTPRTPGNESGLEGLSETLADRYADPLTLFGLSLDLSVERLRGVAPALRSDRLKAGPDTYERWALGRAAAGAPELPLRAGLRVASGEFFFSGGTRMVEASLEIEAKSGNEAAIRALEQALGRPSFEVVLPGALQMMVGWRNGSKYVLATFDDVAMFRLSAFRDEPEDLLAGTEIVLFEGLRDYSERLAQGVSRAELNRDLLRLVTWVAVARGNLEPVE